MKKTHKVKVVAERNKYTKFPFMAVPKFDTQMNTYITGQHIIPGVTAENEGLTVEEMTGIKPLNDAKLKRFPYVINPDNQTPVIHLSNLDLSTDEAGRVINYKDKALLDFYLLTGVVAPSKDAFVIDKHFFYIKDDILEAEKRVSKKKYVYKAMKMIEENTSSRKLSDVALLLSYKVPGYSLNPKNMSLSQLEDSILEACEKYPEHILSCYEKGAEEQLFILKLVNSGIIKRKDDAFYDGQLFLGNQLSEVQIFMTKVENAGNIDKWIKQLRSYEGTTNAPVIENTNRPVSGTASIEIYNKHIANAFEALLSDDIEEATREVDKASILNPNGEKVVVIKNKIQSIKEKQQDSSSSAVETVEQKLAGKTLQQMSGICRQRKFDKEEWQQLDEEGLRKYLLNKINPTTK